MWEARGEIGEDRAASTKRWRRETEASEAGLLSDRIYSSERSANGRDRRAVQALVSLGEMRVGVRAAKRLVKFW